MSLPPQISGAPLLYLREAELDGGVTLILDAAKILTQLAAGVGGANALSAPELRVLLALRRPGGLGVLALAEELGQTKQGVGRTLDLLEGRGLIIRKRDPRDGRGRLVTLTEAGQTIERAIAIALRERLAGAYRQAGPDAVSGAHAVLQAIGKKPLSA